MVEFGQQVSRFAQNDPHLQELRKLAERYSVLLIIGESGTGKKTLVRKFHQLRNVDKGIFRILEGESTPLNSSSKLARLRSANWKRQLNSQSPGTLLIPNIDRLGKSHQLDLLRLIKRRPDFEHQHNRLSLVIMTADPLKTLDPLSPDASEEVAIRQKLQGCQMTLPPLREQREHISKFVRQILSSKTEAGRSPIHYIESAYLQKLQLHDWPGNLRELNAVVSATLKQCSGTTIGISDLPEWFQPTSGMTAIDPEHIPNADYLTRLEFDVQHHRFGEQIARTELELIANALADCEHNRTQAAQVLGISRVTLYNKMKKLGMTSHRSSRVDEN
ncbi:helix-turn-helix domain-containing protein [Rubinisphaera sp.]|uniref:helix-turn-helix domain-containing protein n=1 Tax=Rubinisphaera sp. TaxID=2024857 RepID=UPI000C0D2E71|nr:helix-turn-helix domain-containing protein [Rubinisphaera sp.]MBV11664.1 hypothetical protein [Rubinisphaera sp.]|tara:strand:- start:2243 stop:3238 length:996 start_codon:yes stop_codon:yes gene_type:complete